MKKIIILSLLIFPFQIEAQEVFQKINRDAIWLYGWSSQVDYKNVEPFISEEERGYRFSETNATICDIEGNLLFYTNGISIINFAHDTIVNGGRINPGEYSDGKVETGYNLYQGALILPKPNEDSIYYIFYSEREWLYEIQDGHTQKVFNLNLAVVNMNANNGFGKVIEKDTPIIQDTLDYGKIVANRHANGRDWWVVVPKFRSNKYYRYLLTSTGLIDYGWFSTAVITHEGLGQSTFSTDGTKYVHFTTESIETGQFIAIHNFDRSDGSFYESTQIMYNDTAFAGGIAISPNSKFLYVSSYKKIYQYDLEVSDVEASKVIVAEYDGYHDELSESLKTTFYLAALAPDGKIYISSPNTTKHLHVIEEPNKKGLACNVKQHFMELPTWNHFTMPNFPYYGLGPLDGSPCDTLNINNPPPEADFVYVADSMEVHDISFYNSTLFSPEATDFMPLPDAYAWSFGDGEMSNEKHPFHTYTEDGIYQVCLTATNMGGSDTFCEVLYINVVATAAVDLPVKNVKIHPNPVSEVLYLNYLSSRKGYTVLFDSFGREVQRRQLRKGNILQAWKVRDLASGVYYLQGIVDGQVVFSEKVVKI